MDKTKMAYFKGEDILHIVISDERESDSIELSPNITAELNESGELIGIEILEASSFLRDSILESSQAKICITNRSRGLAQKAVPAADRLCQMNFAWTAFVQ